MKTNLISLVVFGMLFYLFTKPLSLKDTMKCGDII